MRFKIVYILYVLLFISCKKIEKSSEVDIIGHAGSGLATPNSLYASNSKESVEYALGRAGVNGVEIDIQMTSDGILMLYHDVTLDKESSMSGCVNDKLSSDFLNAHYRTFNKEKLVGLADLNMDYFKNKSVYLDLRISNFCKNDYVNKDVYLDALEKAILSFPNTTQIFASLRGLDWAQDLIDMGIKLYIESENVEQFKKDIVLYPEVYGLLIRNAKVTKKDVSVVKDLGKNIVLFEIRSPKSIKEAFRKKPNGILVDDLQSALALKK